MDQKELIQLAKTGNKEALVDLLKSVERSIYSTAFYYMGNEHDAKDITQEALIRVYTKLDSFEEKAQFTTWVQRITTNLCMDKFRSNKHNISIEGAEMIIQDCIDTEKEVENKIMVEELMTKVMLLPEKIKAAMILRYFNEFSYQEIAEVLDIPVNTVKSYLFRGREKIYVEYHQGGVNNE
ncbi:MAG: RNA polymerase sigma factor [Vulcanibacillus sp.]